MSLIIKIVCPEGIITVSDTREVYSTIDEINGTKKYINHKDGIVKSFLKNKISIAIAGNAFIGKKQIKDFFSDFLVNLDAKIKHDQLITEISNLYKDTSKHSTSYYMSFYGEIDQNSKYRNNYKFEPLVFCFNTKEMSLKRLNEDEDGFTYGIFWGGESDRISKSLLEKRINIDTNLLTIEISIELIKNIFKEIGTDFIENNEYPTVSEQFDITIQTLNSSEIIRNFQ